MNDDEDEGPYTCYRCLASTWNDAEICYYCEEEKEGEEDE